jgi:tetratricopeptide (TPR) repeat protein
MNSPHSGWIRKFRTALCAGCLVLLGASQVSAQDGIWERWKSESFTLVPYESFQFHVDFSEMPVRSWKLKVDGGDMNCDVSVLRVQGEALLYYETNQQRHEVDIPWGIGEEVMVVLTCRSEKGSFTVDLLGPPKNQAQAAYSYHVNRALEAYGSGERLRAEDECRLAIDQDPSDAVAKVLLAGFLRDRNYYSRAAEIVDEALQGDLPEDMRRLAQDLREDLAELMAPLPPEIAEGCARAEDLIAADRAGEALEVCDGLLSGDLKLDSAAKSRLQMLRGQALDRLDRNFEAIDAFTQALHLAKSRKNEAVIYFHMGRLYMKMDNLQQARGAYTMALNYGLPSGLDVQARETLKLIENRIQE